MRRLKQKALAQYRYNQRVVDNSESCRNGGVARLTGELYEEAGKGKLQIAYSNCEVGGYVLQGDAVLLIYAINGSFSEWSSSTLSYNGLQAQQLSNNEGVLFTGTIDEVNDFDTGSIRHIIKLHRQIAAANSNQQTLTDVVRQATGADGSVTMTGNLYEGLYGRVQLNTIRPLVYNASDAPVAGYISMTGINNSRVWVTALGEQFDATTGRDVILLQVDVDENGDGVIDSVSQVDTASL